MLPLGHDFVPGIICVLIYHQTNKCSKNVELCMKTGNTRDKAYKHENMFPLLFIGQHFLQAILIFVIIVHFSCFVIILQNFSCLLPSLLIILTCFLSDPSHTTRPFESFLMSYIFEVQIITIIRKKKERNLLHKVKAHKRDGCKQWCEFEWGVEEYVARQEIMGL